MEEKKKFSLAEEIGSLLTTAFITIFVVSMAFTFVFKIVEVEGDSMKNTLYTGDTLITGLLYSEPEQGDIIIVRSDESVLLGDDGQLVKGEGIDKQIVKRIIAVEGQTVNIDFEKGEVSVDGEILSEDYALGMTHLDEGAFTGKYPVTVPQGHVFVLGDNRAVSKDSRSLEIGFVSEESIVGKAIFRMSPFNRIGFLD